MKESRHNDHGAKKKGCAHETGFANEDLVVPEVVTDSVAKGHSLLVQTECDAFDSML